MKFLSHALWLAATVCLINAADSVDESDVEPLLQHREQETSPYGHSFTQILERLTGGRLKYAATGRARENREEDIGVMTDEKLEDFYALKAYMYEKIQGLERHDTERIVDLPPENQLQMIVRATELLTRQEDLWAEQVALTLRCSSLANLFMYYLLKIEKHINLWEFNDRLDKRLENLPNDQTHYRNRAQAYRKSALSRLFEYTKLCELLIRVCKDEPVLELDWQQIPLPSITPKSFKKLMKHPKVDRSYEELLKSYAVQAGERGDIEGVHTDIQYGYHEFDALYNRIKEARRTEIRISVVDAIHLLDFGLELQFSWIAGDYHLERQEHCRRQVTTIYGDEHFETILSQEVALRRDLSETVKAQLATLRIEQVENLIWPKALPSKP